MSARLSAFVIWAAVAASAVFWALRLGAGSPVAPAHTVPVSALVVQHADLARLMGAEPVAAPDAPPPEASSRFHLLGVVAPRGPHAPAVALISIDGKMPRALRSGATVDNDLVLQAVQARSVDIGPRNGPAQIHLELPVLPPPSTGTLPPPVNMAQPVQPPAAQAPQQPAPPEQAPDAAEPAADPAADQPPVPPQSMNQGGEPPTGRMATAMGRGQTAPMVMRGAGGRADR
jgi:general secretion pathway protein C